MVGIQTSFSLGAEQQLRGECNDTARKALEKPPLPTDQIRLSAIFLDWLRSDALVKRVKRLTGGT